VSRRELDAAGIEDPALRSGYERCRRLNAAQGKTYYLATLLLPPAKRPYVHALYGFARYADDIVDDLDPALTTEQRAERFTVWSREVLAELDWGDSSDPIVRALLDTITQWNIPLSYFAEFLEAMRTDLTVESYETYDDLAQYMWGSAAMIGLEMLPILGRADESLRWDVLEPYAIDLGIAFQLTNFLRDVAEDLQRGRVYLPQESLRQFGVDRARLARGVADGPIRNLLAFEIARAHELYERARPGIDLVDPSARQCLTTAVTLYGGILAEIERADYDVFTRRVVVPLPRRARVGARGIVSAWSARRGDARLAGPTTPTSTASARPWRSRTAGLRRARKRSSGR
jgi:15-cis-phytoene synthase